MDRTSSKTDNLFFGAPFNPNTQEVLGPHLTEGVGPFYAPPLKSPKSNIFGQGKLGWAITNYQKAEKNLQKYAQKNIFDKIFFPKIFLTKYFFRKKM